MGTVLHRVLVFFIAGAVVFTACSSDDNGTADKAVLDLSGEGIGTCLLVGDEIDAEVSELPTIDCAKEHTHEIYGTVILEEADYPVYPGTEELDAVAQRECTREFQPYVGSGPRDSDLFYSWLLPTLGSWNDHGDRTILCVASMFDNSKLVGTIKDSNI